MDKTSGDSASTRTVEQGWEEQYEVQQRGGAVFEAPTVVPLHEALRLAEDCWRRDADGRLIDMPAGPSPAIALRRRIVEAAERERDMRWSQLIAATGQRQRRLALIYGEACETVGRVKALPSEASLHLLDVEAAKLGVER